MKNLDQYIKVIVEGLPLEEKEDIREEMIQHLNDHMNELMIKGYSEQESLQIAIKAFGNEKKMNWEMKKAVYPFYKISRFLWNTVFVTLVFCVLSYMIMEHYNPGADNIAPLSSVLGGFFIIFFIAGMAELIYEAIQLSSVKMKYIMNPWVFFFTPSIFIGGIMFLAYFQNPEQYQNGIWVDLLVVPIGAFCYVIARQIFNQLFKRSI
ncbi:permease prefix domain 1-containing protein [Fictibacillus phosphorivorans]|uniref:permease prefix domain 1-containing protein n=1 Tax=Fictibacillus phosphorivorans TaxID=1221500 RepID=UPI0018E8D00D